MGNLNCYLYLTAKHLSSILSLTTSYGAREQKRRVNVTNHHFQDKVHVKNMLEFLFKKLPIKVNSAVDNQGTEIKLCAFADDKTYQMSCCNFNLLVLYFVQCLLLCAPCTPLYHWYSSEHFPQLSQHVFFNFCRQHVHSSFFPFSLLFFFYFSLLFPFPSVLFYFSPFFPFPPCFYFPSFFLF